MSTTLYISLDAEAPGLEPNASDRVAMCACAMELDKLARQLGVKPLGGFMSYDPADVAGYIEGADVGLLPPVQYFDPPEALPTVEALARHLHANPPEFAKVRGRDMTDDLVAELRECGEILAAAAGAGRRFRFWIGE